MKDKKERKREEQYRTEEELKAEVLRQLEEEKRREAGKKPRSPWEKRVENFFYHYKYVVLAAVVALAIGGYFLHDILTKETPDLLLTVVSAGYLPDSTQELMTGILQEHTPDWNGDGRGLAQVSFVHLTLDVAQLELEEQGIEVEPDPEQPFTGMNAQMQYAAMVKLMATLSTGDDPLLLLDDNAYRYLTRANGDPETGGGAPLFLTLEGIIPGAEGDRLPIEATLLEREMHLEWLEGLHFCLQDTAPEQSARYLELLQELTAAP